MKRHVRGEGRGRIGKKRGRGGEVEGERGGGEGGYLSGGNDNDNGASAEAEQETLVLLDALHERMTLIVHCKCHDLEKKMRGIRKGAMMEEGGEEEDLHARHDKEDDAID